MLWVALDVRFMPLRGPTSRRNSTTSALRIDADRSLGPFGIHVTIA